MIKIVIYLVLTFYSIFYANLKDDLINKSKNDHATQWMRKQIKSDLAPFKYINKQMLDQTMKKYSHNKTRFSISKNQINIVQLGSNHELHNIRTQVYLQILQSISNVLKFPDLDFILSTEDGHKGETALYPVPVFIFSKIHHDKAILIPDTDCLIDGHKLLSEVKLGCSKYSWKDKIEKSFWRGASTGAIFTLDNYKEIPRYKLVNLCKKNSDLIDAKFSMLCQMDDQLKTMFRNNNLVDKNVSVTEHLKYKYQILIDGNTSSWSRAYWQLFSNCLILKQESPHNQWYYNLLKPFVHYIPINADLSDLTAKIQWAKSHDNEVQKIIANANKFAQTHLSYADMLYYIYLALSEYSKLQKF